ncbi:hypothetical protein [Streptomyces boncukensis]|uniref:Uncharacterized protein n=1 Tax=Streptomyces boncukensis TaxID=2711219 RepID=A0A6G4WQA7_9ACTN|nr:hypothetical protein [Streptomyces boncukensis]NGO67446.1 hypothetical protein [Streptomyces boncukensis]
MSNPRIAQSDDAVSELRAALAGAGITLPSLGVDLVGVCDRGDAPPLVSLGRCTVETARALAAALKGADR